ncbi:aspartyl-phosphate phosphatase Spo0E family protein [Rossellomorea sp. NPDC077527]|uniref:aspartyl-phosphate phosphatase Spo0E family protein n=1 Tax=Rossellomorea sp. NPDC077527 TaxID=3364510 RepID=UPI0037CB81EC
MNATPKVQTLLQEIETKRIELKYFALFHGFSHPETVKLSQELDELFNRYQRLK